MLPTNVATSARQWHRPNRHLGQPRPPIDTAPANATPAILPPSGRDWSAGCTTSLLRECGQSSCQKDECPLSRFPTSSGESGGGAILASSSISILSLVFR